jgi:sortase family protein
VRSSVGRFAAAVTIGAGVGLLVAAAVGWHAGRQTPGAFGVTSVAHPASSTAPTGSTGSHSTQPAPALSSAARPGPPIMLTIPSQQVRASVVPVINSGGTLQVPDDPALVGWWSASAPAGSSRGSVVIDGHVDSAASGPGALFRLAGLRTSDRIVLSTATGLTRTYAVTGRRVYDKAGGLPADIFDQSGTPRLVLISCGGPFDSAEGSYLDNIVVFAVPIAA